MPSLIKTKTRLNSIKSTQKVIKAMELVASSKIKKSREKAKKSESFFKIIIDNLSLLSSYEELNSTIFSNSDAAKTILIAFSSDMGMCGAYNHNVNKKVLEIIGQNSNLYDIFVVGKKAANKLEYNDINNFEKIINYSMLEEKDIADQISNFVDEKISEGLVKNIQIVYTEFINPLVQEVRVIDFRTTNTEITSTKAHKELLIEPNPEEIISQYFSIYMNGMIYVSLIKSIASEHAYRRNSMETANKNSLELISDLNLEMNRIRQALITQEISEIVGGSEALSKE